MKKDVIINEKDVKFYLENVVNVDWSVVDVKINYLDVHDVTIIEFYFLKQAALGPEILKLQYHDLKLTFISGEFNYSELKGFEVMAQRLVKW